MGSHRKLVTGASGFTGRRLVEALLDLGHPVRGFDLERHADLDPRAEFAAGDLADAAAVNEACADVDAAFHLGALVPFGLPRSVTRRAIERVNVGGTRNVVEASRRRGVARLLLASTTGVVFEGRPIAGGDESLPVTNRQNDAYSRSKAEAERLVLDAHGPELATLALRPNGIWGPGEAHHIPKLLRAARSGLHRLRFAARARTDFTHRENLVHAFLLGERALAERPGQVGGRAYFVTDGEPFNTFEFFAPLLEGLGLPVPRGNLPGAWMLPMASLFESLAWLSRPIRSREPFLTRADVRKCIRDNWFVCDRAERDLGYRPVVRRDEGMRECIAYWKAQAERSAGGR